MSMPKTMSEWIGRLEKVKAMTKKYEPTSTYECPLGDKHEWDQYLCIHCGQKEADWWFDWGKKAIQEEGWIDVDPRTGKPLDQ